MDNPHSTTLSKVCTRCHQEYPATQEFWSYSKLGKFNLNSRCRQCLRELAEESRRKRGMSVKRYRTKDGMRQCGKCNRWLPDTDEYFEKRGDSGKGHRSHCRECRTANYREGMREKRKDPAYVERELAQGREYHHTPGIRQRRNNESREWRLRNAAHIKRYNYHYERTEERKQSRRARNHTIRAMRNAAVGSHTTDDIQALYQSQKGKCWWCGKKLKGKYEVDHRIPLSRGGTNWPNNLCLACKHCNRSKNNKLPHEWIGRLL